MRKSFNLDMSVKATNPNFKMKNTNRVSSTKSGIIYLKMNANKISPLRELDRMYSLSLKNSEIVPLHKKFPDTLHKVKSFNCNYSVKNKTRKNSSKPFYSPSMLLKKPSIKVSIPIEYSDGIYKVSSILRASKPMSEAKNDGRVSQIKSVSISSNKKNDLKFNMTVDSVEKSGLPYLKINPHKISPLKELDFFKEYISDKIPINKTYDNVECNPEFSSVSKSPIYNSGEVALWNKSENSSTVEFPMEWDNLDWGIDDYYQDITDYKMYYSKIFSKEQRDNYYADYTAELQEYQKLHARILNIKRPFEDLRLCLSTCQRETEEYKEIYNLLEEKYKAYQKDHNYIYTRLRSNHLYKKLSYIKKLIKEFDEMKLWGKNA